MIPDDDVTGLDRAVLAMGDGPEAERAFYGELAATELYLALDGEADGETVTPQLFSVEGGSFVLVFDREERLSAFAEGPVAHAALSGRALAAMLAGQGVGLALNPEVTEASLLLGPEAVDWLAEALGPGPDEVEDRVQEVGPPGTVPEGLLTALDRRLATAMGRARSAYLVSATVEAGGRGHLLAFVDPVPGAEGALATLVQEALIFSGVDAGTLDVAFVAAQDPVAARLARVGLRFDLPQPEAPAAPQPPGSDPDRPPRLR